MELVNIQYAGTGIQPTNLSQQDSQLVTSDLINTGFGKDGDYIELYIYGQEGQLLDIDYDASDYYPFLTNNPQNNTYSNLLLDPEKDLKNRGYNRGNLNIQYNFYTRLFNSAFNRFYWIKEISTSRTEIKLASQVLSDDLIQQGFSAYQNYISSKNYYPTFYLNFGNNKTIIANNVAYTEDAEGAYLIVKLYEALPNEYDLKTQLWIVDKVAESVSFNVSIEVEAEDTQDLNRLRGPNYNVLLNTKNGQTTPYYNYNNLLTSELSSSFQKLKSYYQDKAIQINVDYSNFANFVHFSSAVERVNNFVYKLQLIESANANIAAQRNIVANSTYVNSTITAEQQVINNLIKNFDTYEYFLYFESSSWAWPKSTSTQPYQLYSTTSSQATSFLGDTNTIPTGTTQSLLWSASYYDSTNKDLLHNSIPQYLLDDPSNAPYITFVDMIGQHFDNIWIYYKDVTNRYNATNNPNTGISLDLVSDALKGLGFNLYTNTNVSDNLYYTLFGINPDGSLLPPTGSEIITNYVTSSLATLPAETIQDELYKRLYHNLPYLLKSKGTARGVKALISTFGIPDSILTVREFGGNFTGSLDGILDLNTSDYKVAIVTGSGGNVTGSQTLSSSLLSPYVTLQYYKGNTRLNNTNVEVGFSPADVINNNIATTEGTFSLDQLIGSPGYQYSSSYFPLVSASNAYFANYTASNSIWEYIRLLKFYNNTLFKTVKDFIPARANVSTGIIVKSHMYERNKYARHEPIMDFNDYSQSIDLGTISGSEGGALTYSTAWSGFVDTPLGPALYNSTDGIERFNGELSGSNLVLTDGQAFKQNQFIPIFLEYYLGTVEGDFLATEGARDLFAVSYGQTQETSLIGALYQNISSSVRSKFMLDLDYNSDQLKPVNYNAVTFSLSGSVLNNYNTYTNPNNPYAQVQDFNYYLNRSIIPRYEGSKMISAQYNVYTPGDQSYGKTAAIDKFKYQYAYLVDIYTASVYFPNRSNAQIKYLIDNDENVLDLTKTNQNIFEIQNVFKSGESVDIALFQYDELNPYTQQLANNPTVAVYEGGWRYLPMLHNISRSSNYQDFTLSSFIETNLSVGGTIPTSSNFDVTKYALSWWAVEEQVTPCGTLGGGSSNYSIYISASYIGGGNLTNNISLLVNYKTPGINSCGSSGNIRINMSSGTNKGVSPSIITYTLPPTCNGSGNSAAGGTNWPTNVSVNCPLTITAISTQGSTEYTFYQTNFTSSQSCVYYLSQSNEIVFNTTMSYYYNYYQPFTFSSSGDIDWRSGSLEPVIVPFNVQPGDKISFYNPYTLGWGETFEYTIKSGPRYIGNPINTTSSVMLFELSSPVNLNVFSSGSGVPTESISKAQHRSCRYIMWKHVPDETNVILRYNPKDSTIIENGLLLPQYIDPVVRQNSGNVIKSLKQQNLIVDQVPIN